MFSWLGFIASSFALIDDSVMCILHHLCHHPLDVTIKKKPLPPWCFFSSAEAHIS